MPARWEGFKPIHMPKNTGTGVILGAIQRRARLRPYLVHVVARRLVVRQP